MEYRVYAILDGTDTVTIPAHWSLGYEFIEHFAVRKGLHATGVGVMREFLPGKQAMLEVERPPE